MWISLIIGIGLFIAGIIDGQIFFGVLGAIGWVGWAYEEYYSKQLKELNE